MPTHALRLAALLALLAGASAHAQSPDFTRLTWASKPSTLFGPSEQLVIEASGAVRLETVDPAGTERLGAAPLVLRGRLDPTELQALAAALRAPGFDQLPKLIDGNYHGQRVAITLERAARPTLQLEGTAGRFGAHDALLLPLEQAVTQVRERLRADSTELTLKIERIPLPRSIRSDEDLDLVVGGQGQPGLEFTELRAVLRGRTLTLQALARQVPLGPAQPFSARLRVPRAGRIGQGWLHVKFDPAGLGAMVPIVQAESPRDGMFTGKIARKRDAVSLEFRVSSEDTRRIRLDPAASAALGRFEGEYVQLEGERDAEGRLRLRRLIRPERRAVRGVTRYYGAIEAIGLGNLVPFGPAKQVLERIEKGTPVLVEGWFFSDGGPTPPRKWYDVGGRNLYRGQRLYAERVRARASEALELKRRLRSKGAIAAGEEVWVGERRLFGWLAEVSSLDGSKVGRARLKRFDFAHPLPLATDRATGSGAGIVGGLGGVSGP